MEALEYKPGRLRPAVLIPGLKPYVASRDFQTVEDALAWARGFLQGPSTFIRDGTTLRIGSEIYAIVRHGPAYTIRPLGPVRRPGSK